MAKESGGTIGDGVAGDCEEELRGVGWGLVVECHTFKGGERSEAGPRQVKGYERVIAWEVGAHCGWLVVGVVGLGIYGLWTR